MMDDWKAAADRWFAQNRKRFFDGFEGTTELLRKVRSAFRRRARLRFGVSRYKPHQGDQEIARRRDQLERGFIRIERGFIRIERGFIRVSGPRTSRPHLDKPPPREASSSGRAKRPKAARRPPPCSKPRTKGFFLARQMRRDGRV